MGNCQENRTTKIGVIFSKAAFMPQKRNYNEFAV